MSKLEDIGAGIGDYALALMEQDLEKVESGELIVQSNPDGGTVIAEAPKDTPDISKVRVGDDFLLSIFEQANWDNEVKITKTVKPQPVPTQRVIKESSNPQTKLIELTQRLLQITSELGGVLKEMTAVGSIGVNLAGPQKELTKKKKTVVKQKQYSEELANSLKNKIKPEKRNPRLESLLNKLKSESS